MKILILHNKLPYPPKDGGSIAVLELALELSEQQHQVSLLCINTKKHFFPVEKIPQEIKNKINIHTINVNTDIKLRKLITNFLFSKKPYHQIRFYSERFKNELLNLLKNNSFDFILLDGLYVTPYIYDIKNNFNNLTVYRAHNIESLIWQRLANNEKNIFKKIYLKSLSKRLKNLEKKIINEVDVVLTLTEYDKSLLEKFDCKRPIFVSPAGLNLNNYVLTDEKVDFPSVFFIGALDWIPNQEGLIWFLDNVWNKIINKHPEIKLDIAGRNAPLWLQNILKDRPSIIFHGEIDNAKEFMRKKAIMIVPLFSGSGMRIKILEGMALGKTIISTSIGAEGIPVENNKNIIIANTADEFVFYITKLIENKAIYDNISKQAREFIYKNFNISFIVKNTLNFISKVKLS